MSTPHTISFTKMHGLGNDYIYVDCFAQRRSGLDAPALSRAIADRHRGVGSDGLILICPPSPGVKADVRMEMYNADGSRGEMCGNGIRCVAKYAVEHGLAGRNAPAGASAIQTELNDALSFLREPMGLREVTAKDLRVETDRGVLMLTAFCSDNEVTAVRVDMGPPILRPRDIPMAMDGERCIHRPHTVAGKNLALTCVSMGNPHAVAFLDAETDADLSAFPLTEIGPLVEHDPLFPRRVNFHVARVHSRGEITMRTWERGSGITQACGTGACAVLVAGVLEGRTGREALVHLPGGDLRIEWAGTDETETVFKTGPATEICTGQWPL